MVRGSGGRERKSKRLLRWTLLDAIRVIRNFHTRAVHTGEHDETRADGLGARLYRFAITDVIPREVWIEDTVLAYC